MPDGDLTEILGREATRRRPKTPGGSVKGDAEGQSGKAATAQEVPVAEIVRVTPAAEIVDPPLGTISGGRMYKAGDTDGCGDKVQTVFVGTVHFQIYSAIAKSGHVRLRYTLPDDYPSAKRLRSHLAPIARDLAEVSDIIAGISGTELRLPWQSKTFAMHERAMDMMARAIQMAFEGQVEAAEKLLARARRQVTTCRDSRNRMRYIVANLFAVLAIGVLWTWDWGTWAQTSFLVDPSSLGDNGSFRVIDILALGALGAFFSVSTTLKAINVQHSISFVEMLYAGFVRVPIGVIAAAVTILLISGDWMLGAVAEGSLIWSYYLFGFLAGFSELLVPNALKQVENGSSVDASNGKKAE